MRRIPSAPLMLLALVLLAGCAPGDTVPAAQTPGLTQPRTSVPTPSGVPSPDSTVPAVSPEPSPPPPSLCYIAGESVRVREEAGTDAAVLCSLPCGTEVIRLENAEGWSKVQYADITGYVRDDLLSDTRPETPPLTPRALSEPKIIVRKSRRLLELWDGDSLVGSFSVGLGWEPEGPKRAEGDGRTPEGQYYVCMRNANSRFYLSLGVSYPNEADARLALEEGRIDQNTYDEIARAVDQGQRPPWNTALGGEIMIHGCGGDRDWTAGCVGVDDGVMDILWAACPLGTPITILP